MKYTKEQILAPFESFGYSYYHFELVTEGKYLPADAEFNFADIPHVKYIHKEFQTVPAMVEQDKLGTLHFQKFLGLAFPLAVLCYHHSRTSQTSYFTFLCFMVIVTTEFEQIGQDRCRVRSKYSIGTSKWLRFLSPIMRWALTKNYHGLMKDDIPMRERRGELRSWGFKFRTDSRRYGYEESLNVGAINVVPPHESQMPETVRFNLASLPQGGEAFVGRDDHFGLRVLRNANDELMFYPRLCDHEGASMDKARCVGKKLECPWHGKMFAPVATLKLEGAKSVSAQTELHQIEAVNGMVTVKVLASGIEKVRAQASCAPIGATAQPATS